jgi:hypothetical protein
MTHEEIERQAKETVDLMIKFFEQIGDIWPFHRQQQIDKFGRARYRLTREETQQLKSLGLQNFFNTSWPKPSP